MSDIHIASLTNSEHKVPQDAIPPTQPAPIKAVPHRYTYSKELGIQLLRTAKRRAVEEDSTARLGCPRKYICDENDAICKDGAVKRSDGSSIQVLPVGHVLQSAERWCIDNDDGADTNTIPPPPSSSPPPSRQFPQTIITVVNLDTISAALSLISLSGDDDTVALSFANDEVPGGYYRAGARAQEEDLCCTIPELYWTINTEKATNYPIPPGTALLSRDLYLVRSPKNYDLLLDRLPAATGQASVRPTDITCVVEEKADAHKECGSKCPRLSIITAAMPRGLGDKRPPGGFMNPVSEWHKTVSRRILSVLLAAKASGKKDVVLGAFGAGVFGNPPKYVAEVFKEQLQDRRFMGCFHQIVFAIIDPMGTGNLNPFIDSFSC